jgi:hypothetical protein
MRKLSLFWSDAWQFRNAIVIAKAIQKMVLFIRSVFDEFQATYGFFRLENGYIETLFQVVQVQVIITEVSVEENPLPHEIEN